ncbi:MAG: hypothetical protein ABI239_00515 [Aquihabitans sp.]
MPKKVALLVLWCTILGIGVAMLLLAALGSDGFSTLTNGISLAMDVHFFVVNTVLSGLMLAVAWRRGMALGIGAILQPLVVGASISVVLHLGTEPDAMAARIALLAAAIPVITVGVAGYLATGAGAGPAEAAVQSFDPPVPFRWGYSTFQATGSLVGWLLGAAIGPGTILVILLLGPLVDLLSARVRIFHIVPQRRDPALTT